MTFPGYTVMLEQQGHFKREKGKDLLLQMGERSPAEGKPLGQAHTRKPCPDSWLSARFAAPLHPLGWMTSLAGLGF